MAVPVSTPWGEIQITLAAFPLSSIHDPHLEVSVLEVTMAWCQSTIAAVWCPKFKRQRISLCSILACNTSFRRINSSDWGKCNSASKIIVQVFIKIYRKYEGIDPEELKDIVPEDPTHPTFKTNPHVKPLITPLSEEELLKQSYIEIF